MAKITHQMTDDEWQVRATESAIAACRDLLKGGINSRATLASLGNIEWGWIAAASVFAWIKVRAEQAVAEGISPEVTIRTMSHQVPGPWEAGAIESILPALGDIKGVDWSKPVGFWSKQEIIRFAFHINILVNKALAARDKAQVGAIVTSNKDTVERLHSAANGGPLMSHAEIHDEDIPF
ncbi:hypothetical protein [Bradyrhizobium elkanii]|uniref:hypothetical protein n=1 Tax=Bradyrhizobium elkanii TaxID=29448 RepID=UPI00040E5F6C|nr:hypothetical protein [Bradyrhizobium elkanii]